MAAFAAVPEVPKPVQPTVKEAEVAQISDAYFVRAKARAALKSAALPAGAQYQHLESGADGSLTVVVTGDSNARAKSSVVTAAIGEKVRAAAVDTDVKVKFTSIADKTLDDAVDQLSDYKSWAGDLAGLVNLVSADQTTSVVTIGSKVKSAELERRATARFKVPLKFIISQPAQADGRYNDYAPFSAGNGLRHFAAGSEEPYKAVCTQGFAWKSWSDGLTYGSTAGHCFSRGTNIYNGGRKIGEVVGRWFSDKGPTDFELIRMTAGVVGGTVWLGGVETKDLRIVAGADNVNSDENINEKVCFSGAAHSGICGLIKDANVTRTFTNDDGLEYTIRNCTCVQVPWSGPYAGDSGGPVLNTYKNGDAFAWGQILGSSRTEPNCNRIYTPVLAISAAVKASILLG